MNTQTFHLPLLDATDYLDYCIADELCSLGRHYDRIELTVLAHGAGTQTSVLLALAACNWKIPPGQPGNISIDLALFADVGDEGTPCEWPETIEFLERLNWFARLPLLRVAPALWNPYLHGDDSGLYDRYLARKTMPFRLFRSCTDWFKVQPQLQVLTYLHERAADAGIDLRIRQVIGYSADEKERAAKFQPELPFIRPWFPLIEWGWSREMTLAQYAALLPDVAMTIGIPERSGCWFCPFQKRGKFNPVTLEPTPRSWLALHHQHPNLFAAAVQMEARQNERRYLEGKPPAYLYGSHPLSYWMEPKRTGVQMALDLINEGDGDGDDTCQSWGCMR